MLSKHLHLTGGGMGGEETGPYLAEISVCISAVTSCLLTCDRGDVAGRTGGSSVETASSNAVMRSMVGVRLVASSAWRF